MTLYREYLSVALNPKAWGRIVSPRSVSGENINALVGPEDFVSIVLMILSIFIFILEILFGTSDGQYAIANRLQFLGALFILFFFTVAKSRAMNQGLSVRQMNRHRILQCFGIWLNGAVLSLYLMNASH